MSVMGNAHSRILRLVRNDYEPVPVIRTGLHALDKTLSDGGLPLNKMTVIAARTSHGKTATAVRLAVNFALSARRVVVLWCEDEELEFDLRALSVLARTPYRAVREAYRAKTLETVWDRVPAQRKELWERYCSTERHERPTPALLAYGLASESGTAFILDHIGEVDWGDGRKHELIGDGLRLIRAEALKQGNLFVAMAQLNRDWDRRKASSENPDKVRPCLSDIENSGQIEQVARVCIIAEKAMRRDGEDDVATGEYRYHVFKPSIGVAVCRWHDDLAVPDNFEGGEQEGVHWSDSREETA